MGPRVPLRLVSGSTKVSKMLSPLEMYFQFPSGRFISLPEQYVCGEEWYGTFPSRHCQGGEQATLFARLLKHSHTCSLPLQQQLVISRLSCLIPWIHCCSGFREFFARTLWVFRSSRNGPKTLGAQSCFWKVRGRMGPVHRGSDVSLPRWRHTGPNRFGQVGRAAFITAGPAWTQRRGTILLYSFLGPNCKIL